MKRFILFKISYFGSENYFKLANVNGINLIHFMKVHGSIPRTFNHFFFIRF